MPFRLPRTLTLPSGRRVTVSARDAVTPVAGEDEPLFGDALRVLDGEVLVAERGGAIDPRDLPVGDFHVLRAVLIKAGLVPEEEVEIDCHNCGEILAVRPCSGLETAPWEDGELGDPELDRTEPFGAPLPIAPLPISRVREAKEVTFAPRTVREALPLFAALGRDPLVIDEAVVEAMGIESLGGVAARGRIARALSSCDERAFASVTEAFLSCHYPLRLACDVFCPRCKARNTVDAPTLREFEIGDVRDGAPDGADGASPPLPPLEEFVEIAHAIAAPRIAEIPGEAPELVVDDGTPAVDDGGEPLLGSYVPPPPRDAPVPTRPPTVTIYYRTFARIEREEGRYDWEGELRETIEHELEHHLFFLRGDDPMDEAEHAEIDREAARVLGEREVTRRALVVFGLSIPDFFVRAWPLVVIAALVLAISVAEARCGQ